MKVEEEYKLYQVQASVQLELEHWLIEFPEAWAETAGLGLAAEQPPVMVLKPMATPIRKRQFPMSKEAQEGISLHIQRLYKEGILVKCQSAWNRLRVKKPGTGDYRPVQVLQEVNS